MERMPMCRICLVENVRMNIVVDKNLHELYELLTDIPFVTEDSRPMLACFICFAKLKQCCQLKRKCLESEELFAQMMNEPVSLVNRDQLQCFSGLIITPVEEISIVDVSYVESSTVKEELPAGYERLDDTIELKVEQQSDDLKLDNVHIDYSDVGDTTAHNYSETDSEDDVPLTEFKIELEEEQEVSRKQEASDTPWAPVAKTRRTELNDVITELETTEQSDTKVVRITENCTSKPGLEFEKPPTYIRNYRKKCNQDNIKCNISDKGIDSDINKNRRLYVKDKRFKCDICHRCFIQKSQLTIHIRTHTGEKPYKCDICDSCFKVKDHLKRHSRTHTGDKPFKCDICQRCFSQKPHLTSHVRTHTGEKPFKCDICQRCFGKKAYLTNHYLTHTGEKPFKCDVCQRRLKSKSDLTKHVRTHTGEKPFKCEICQRCFSQKAHLTSHIRRHTGDKPFKCEFCQRRFNEKSDLTKHIRTHTGEYPYKCDICQHKFNQKSNLTTHIRTHTKPSNKIYRV